MNRHELTPELSVGEIGASGSAHVVGNGRQQCGSRMDQRRWLNQGPDGRNVRAQSMVIVALDRERNLAKDGGHGR